MAEVADPKTSVRCSSRDNEESALKVSLYFYIFYCIVILTRSNSLFSI